MMIASRICVVSSVVLLLLPRGGMAQSAVTGAIPRTLTGQPDLQGVWDYRSLTPLERPAELGAQEFRSDEERAAFVSETLERRNNDGRREGVDDVTGAYNDFWLDYGSRASNRTSLITDPPNGRLPALQPDAIRSVSVERPGDYPGDIRPVRLRSGGISVNGPVGPEDRALAERCLLGFNSGPPMIPSVYNNNVQILQTPDHVVIYNEMVHNARIIPIGTDARHGLRQYSGESRARWEGDTLVIETRGFLRETSLGGSSRDTYVVERLTRLDPETVAYEFTVEDPNNFTQPWTAMMPLRQTEGPLFEYACHEGNIGMVGIIAGARNLDTQKVP